MWVVSRTLSDASRISCRNQREVRFGKDSVQGVTHPLVGVEKSLEFVFLLDAREFLVKETVEELRLVRTQNEIQRFVPYIVAFTNRPNLESFESHCPILKELSRFLSTCTKLESAATTDLIEDSHNQSECVRVAPRYILHDRFF